MIIILYYFLIINTLAFMLLGYDKFLAKANKYRISERTLLGFVFVGGTIGSGVAMLIFKHKTSKLSYLWKFWRIVMLQCLITFLLLYYHPIRL